MTDRACRCYCHSLANLAEASHAAHCGPGRRCGCWEDCLRDCACHATDPDEAES